MINKKGNYGFNQGIYSVTGFGEIRKDKEFLKGIETSIILSNLMKTIKEQNKDFAWIYYVSKDGHSTLYPNIDTFSHPWIKEYFDMPLWKLSLPKNNPSRELFFTAMPISASVTLYSRSLYCDASMLISNLRRLTILT